MSPLLTDELPDGGDWVYQLKWDGVRIIALLDSGEVSLYSKRMLPKLTVYPELAKALAAWSAKHPERLVLDGEAIVFDPVKQRPVFQKVLQRERLKLPSGIARATSSLPVQYVLFDLLHAGGRDLAPLPYSERHRLLTERFPAPEGPLMVTEQFEDGEALWKWVEERGWEGVVAKRLTAPYREGKKHKDWFKKKTEVRLEVEIVGITIREGRLASLVMTENGQFLGKVSLGLNEERKALILDYATDTGIRGSSPFSVLPADLKQDRIVWLDTPFSCTVTGLELTEAGVLRHPKILSFGKGTRP